MQQNKILISDKIAEVCSALLKENGFWVDEKHEMTPDEFNGIIEGYQALIVRSATKVTEEVIKRGKNLRIIGRAGAGVDNIDLEAATLAGITVVNVPDGNSISAAELTIGLMIALARHIPASQASLQSGNWERHLFKGVELFGKTLGIIGLGKIGFEVAKRARAFGMHILAHDPLISTDAFHKADAQPVSLKEIFRQSDFVTVHVPLNPQTRGLINAEHFQYSKRSLRLINASRGGVVNENALYDALKKGNIAGAALDVYEKEPPINNPLIGLNNVVTTPHLGASTTEAQTKVAEKIAYLVVDFFHNGTVENIANPGVSQHT